MCQGFDRTSIPEFWLSGLEGPFLTDFAQATVEQGVLLPVGSCHFNGFLTPMGNGLARERAAS
jgi:hypothetical protein